MVPNSSVPKASDKIADIIPEQNIVAAELPTQASAESELDRAAINRAVVNIATIDRATTEGASAPSSRGRFIAAAVFCILSVVAFSVTAAKPGEQPSKLTLVLSGAVSAVAVLVEIARLAAAHQLLKSPFTLLPVIGVGFVSAAAFVAALIGGEGAVYPLLAAAPTLAVATLFIGNAWALNGERRFRRDSDFLFPKERRKEEVRLGDTVQYKAGDIITVDSRIQSGCLALDERSVSPVCIFRIREEQEVVFAGSEVLAGNATVVALTTRADSTLSRLQAAISPMIESAQSSLEVEDSRASRWSALVILFLSIAAGIFWHERIAGFSQALLAAGTVALFGSTCVVSGLLYGLRRELVQSWMRRGYLLFSASSIRELAAITSIECDASRCGAGSLLKTASLEILDDRLARTSLCDFVCALVGRAEDPILAAIGEYCRRNGKTPSVERVLDLREYLGRGICGTVHGVELTVGAEDFLVERGIMVQPSDGTLTTAGEHLVLIAIDDDVVARVHVAYDQESVIPSGVLTEWQGGISAYVSPGVARTLGDETLLIRGRESDLLAQVSSREVTLFDSEECAIKRSTLIAFTPEIAPIEALLRECRADLRTVDRFRLLVGFGGLMVLAATFAGATTPLVPLLVVAFVGAVVHLSHSKGLKA
jgi:cation transport ATPase